VEKEADGRARKVWEAWKAYDEHKHARKLRAADRKHLNARLTEGYSLEDLLVVLKWAHESDCWYHEHGAQGLSILFKPKGFEDRLEDAIRWRNAPPPVADYGIGHDPKIYDYDYQPPPEPKAKEGPNDDIEF